MKMQNIGVAVVAIVSLGLIPHVEIGQARELQACGVSITSPKTGDRGGDDILVTGKATLPPDTYLLPFAKRHGLAVWWPAGGGPASIEHGEYAVLVPLGTARDAGAQFDVVVQLVDAAANARVQAWFRRSEETGTYPGMTLPPFVPGCGVPPRVSVVKAH